MWKIVFLLALVESGLCGIFDFTGFDDPYNTFFLNRPAAIIRQHHGRCTTTLAGTNQEGVCLTRPECTLSGGRPQGRQSCILGTCCVYSRGCNQISTKRVSYFEGTTTNDNSECTYTVRAENVNICQMRLDFDSLNLPEPTRTTIPGATIQDTTLTGPYTCKDAAFRVESPNSGRIPSLCGNNNGQHIYVPVNASRGERDMVIKIINNFVNTGTGNNNANSISWKIKVTQLECPTFSKHQKPIRIWEDSLLVAPAGCLQYYLNPSGTIRNLGYDTGNTGTALANNHYEADLNYAICFRRTPDMCGMDFNVDQFSLSGNMDTGGLTSNLDCTYTTDNGILQASDYLWFPNAQFTTIDPNIGGPPTITNRDRYCGVINANSRIRAVTPGPFYIFFRTDNRVLDANFANIDGTPNAVPPVFDPENGWELTYTTLYGNNCGLTSF